MSVLKKVFLRELPDGTTGVGFGAWLLGIVLLVTAMWWFSTRYDSTSSMAKARAMTGADQQKPERRVKVDVKAVSDSALATRPIDLSAPEAKTTLRGSERGVRLDAPTVKPPAPAILAPEDDPLASVLATSNADAAADRSARLRPRGTSGVPAPAYSRSSDSFDLRRSGSDGARTQSELPPIGSLVVPTIAQSSRATATAPTSASPYSKSFRSPAVRFLPRGERIPVYVLNTVESGKTSGFVELGVARNIYFNGRLVLPFGFRFLGVAADDGKGQRMKINVDSIRDRTGLEVAASAYAEDSAGRVGVPAYYYAPPLLTQMAPLLASFLQSYSQAVANSKGYTVIQLADGVSQVKPAETRSQMLEASTKAIGDFLSQQVTELQDRNPAYLAVYAGTPAYIRLSSALVTDPFFEAERLAGQGGLVSISEGVPDAGALGGKTTAASVVNATKTAGGDAGTRASRPTNEAYEWTATPRQSAPPLPAEETSTSP